MRAFIKEYANLKALITVVAVLIWGYVFWAGYTQLRPSSARVIQETKERLAGKIEYVAREKPLFIYPVEGLSDPFEKDRAKKMEIPLPEPKTEETSLVVKAILWNEKGAIAILEEKDKGMNYTVKVGDEVGGQKVVEIKRNSIVLKSGEKETTLQLWKEITGIKK